MAGGRLGSRIYLMRGRVLGMTGTRVRGMFLSTILLSIMVQGMDYNQVSGFRGVSKEGREVEDVKNEGKCCC